MNCSLCLGKIEEEPTYIDKYPHHEDCAKKVRYYLKTKEAKGST